MPKKLPKKLKEKEFYCVGQRKRCTAKVEDICVVEFRNGAVALEAYIPKYDTTAYKFIKQSKINAMTKKYGDC